MSLDASEYAKLREQLLDAIYRLDLTASAIEQIGAGCPGAFARIKIFSPEIDADRQIERIRQCLAAWIGTCDVTLHAHGYEIRAPRAVRK